MSRASIGSAKAAVLPLPVCAAARMSRPARAAGMVAHCTGVGVVMRRLVRAFTSQPGRPSARKLVAAGAAELKEEEEAAEAEAEAAEAAGAMPSSAGASEEREEGAGRDSVAEADGRERL